VNGEVKISPSDSHCIGIEKRNGLIVCEAADGISNIFSDPWQGKQLLTVVWNFASTFSDDMLRHLLEGRNSPRQPQGA
jgi:hypothetical protein